MRRRFPWKRSLMVLALIVAGAAIYIFWPVQVDLSQLAHDGDGHDVEILRDTWGVPHIFGISDADAAFGLAFANAEDDFLTIQHSDQSAQFVARKLKPVWLDEADIRANLERAYRP